MARFCADLLRCFDLSEEELRERADARVSSGCASAWAGRVFTCAAALEYPSRFACSVHRTPPARALLPVSAALFMFELQLAPLFPRFVSLNTCAVEGVQVRG